MSDGRAFMKKRTIYRYAEAKISSAPRGSVEVEVKNSPSSNLPNENPTHKTKNLDEGTPKTNTKTPHVASCPVLDNSDDSASEGNDPFAIKHTKSALDLFVKSTKECDCLQSDDNYSKSSYLPSFVMSFGSPLSVDETNGASVMSGESLSKPKNDMHISGIERVKSSESRAPILTDAISNAKSMGSRSRNDSIQRRYSFSQKNELIKEDVAPMIVDDDSVVSSGSASSPMRRTASFASHLVSLMHGTSGESSLDQQASIDPIFSVSQQPATPSSPKKVNDEDSSEWAEEDSLDEDATAFSPPEITYFFGK